MCIWVLVWLGGVVVGRWTWSTGRARVWLGPPRFRVQPWASCSQFTHVNFSSINLVPAQAWKVTVGLVSHWPWTPIYYSIPALSISHRLQWYFHLRAHGLCKGDENPAYPSAGVYPYTVWVLGSLSFCMGVIEQHADIDRYGSFIYTCRRLSIVSLQLKSY